MATGHGYRQPPRHVHAYEMAAVIGNSLCVLYDYHDPSWLLPTI